MNIIVNKIEIARIMPVCEMQFSENFDFLILTTTTTTTGPAVPTYYDCCIFDRPE